MLDEPIAVAIVVEVGSKLHKRSNVQITLILYIP